MLRVLRGVVVSTAVLLVSNLGQAQQTVQVLEHHVRPAVSSGRAVLAGSLPAERRLSFSFVLPLRNQSELDSLLARLYDASSADYRHFLSVEEFTARFGPTAEDYLPGGGRVCAGQRIQCYRQSCEPHGCAGERHSGADRGILSCADERLPASDGRSHLLFAGP